MSGTRRGAVVVAAVFGACVAPAHPGATAAGGDDPGKSAARGDAGPRLRRLVQGFDADDKLVSSFEPIDTAAARDRRRALADEAARALESIEPAQLDRDERVDLLLFRNDLETRRARLAWAEEDARAAAPLLPFLEAVVRIEQTDRASAPWSPQELATWLTEAATRARESKDHPDAAAAAALQQPLAIAFAAARARECRAFVDEWRGRNAPADPQLEFWIKVPAEQAVASLGAVADWLGGPVLDELRKKPEGSPFAIGRDRYLAELRFEGIELTPEQMLEFGEQKLRELQAEITKETEAEVAADGFGLDEGLKGRPIDWKLGLELAKRDTVPIGGQRLFVQSVGEEAVRFAREQQLFPIPDLCDECWRVKLSSLETQKNYAYGFYGQNFMGVAAPLPDMEQERKLECLRSNARPFTRTVVPHELIPGHHLQGFYADRRPERERYHSPFFVEGWALHGEMTFDEHGFFRTPRERIGHLFWRLLRAARIVASTRFHLREMTQEQMVDFMVDNAGLERSAAQAEVDRYMRFSPLYQCAYLYGATQIRALRDECRATWGTEFTELRFNTELVQQGSIPIRFAREALLGRP